MDDERTPEDKSDWGFKNIPYDVVCRHSCEACQLLKTGKVTFISLDHWMNSGEMTGLDVANFILSGAKDGSIPRLEYDCHSGDIEKRYLIYKILRQAEDEWDLREMRK